MQVFIIRELNKHRNLLLFILRWFYLRLKNILLGHYHNLQDKE